MRADNSFDPSSLLKTEHRPWPMPESPWVLRQVWHDLLFAHWPAAVSAIRSLVPPALEVDTFDGQAWIGVVPFDVTDSAPRGVPALPIVSAYAELNVRTYVTAGGKPGVYFFSLDASQALVAGAARGLLNLPYFSAAMEVQHAGDTVEFSSSRNGNAKASFEASYQGVGEPSRAVSGSIEHFLTERYCLYAMDHGGKPYRLEIHHPAWPLQTAEAEIRRNGVCAAAGITRRHARAIFHFSRRQDMVGWLPDAL